MEEKIAYHRKKKKKTGLEVVTMGAEWGRERVCEFGCGTVIRRFPTTTVNLREKKGGKNTT